MNHLKLNKSCRAGQPAVKRFTTEEGVAGRGLKASTKCVLILFSSVQSCQGVSVCVVCISSLNLPQHVKFLNVATERA